jgi:hypothetical protein
MPDLVHLPAPQALDRLRMLCLALPGVTERLSHGEPSWFVDRRSAGPAEPPSSAPSSAPSGGAESPSATTSGTRRSASRQFLTLADHHHDDRFGFWAAAPAGAQRRWIALDDHRFFRPPYVGGRGWIGVYLDVEQDWGDVAEIVADAHAVAVAVARR